MWEDFKWQTVRLASEPSTADPAPTEGVSGYYGRRSQHLLRSVCPRRRTCINDPPDLAARNPFRLSALTTDMQRYAPAELCCVVLQGDRVLDALNPSEPQQPMMPRLSASFASYELALGWA